MVDFTCTYCGQALEASDEQRGQPFECSACNHRVIVPRVSAGGADSAAGKSAMGVCPNCLESVPARAMRCSGCGARFFDPNAEPSIFADTPPVNGTESADGADNAPPKSTGVPATGAAGANDEASSRAAGEAPGASEVGPAIEFACSKCKHPLSASASCAGQAVRCPNCGLHERVPKKRFSLRLRRH